MKTTELAKTKPAITVKVLTPGIVSQLLNTRGEVAMDADPLLPGEEIVGYVMSGVGVLVRAGNGNLRLCHAYRLHKAEVEAGRCPAEFSQREWLRSIPQLFLS